MELSYCSCSPSRAPMVSEPVPVLVPVPMPPAALPRRTGHVKGPAGKVAVTQLPNESETLGLSSLYLGFGSMHRAQVALQVSRSCCLAPDASARQYPGVWQHQSPVHFPPAP